MKKEQTECLRCGTCCTGGGPALHTEDLPLVREWEIPFAQLITVRAGELAYNPVADALLPIRRELVKISGVGEDMELLLLRPR